MIDIYKIGSDFRYHKYDTWTDGKFSGPLSELKLKEDEVKKRFNTSYYRTAGDEEDTVKFEIPDEIFEQAGINPKKMSPDQLKAMFAQLKEQGLLKPVEGKGATSGSTDSAHPGLVKKKVMARGKDGKLYDTTKWVKPGEDVPEGKLPKPKKPELVIRGLNTPEGEEEEKPKEDKSKEEPKKDAEEIKGKEFMDWHDDKEIPGGVTVGSVVDVGKFGEVKVKDIINGVIIGEDDKPYAVTSIEEVISNPDEKEEPKEEEPKSKKEKPKKEKPKKEKPKKKEEPTEKAISDMESHIDKLNDISDGEILLKTVSDYTGGDFALFNTYLRTGKFKVERMGKPTPAGKKDKQKLDERMKVLSNFLEDAPKIKETVYRGMGWGTSKRDKKDFDKFIYDVENNEELSLKSFTSTSVNKEIAEYFGDNTHSIMFEIKSNNGVYLNGTSAFPTEKEVLFNKNSNFEIQSIDKSDYPRRVIIKLQEKEIKKSDKSKTKRTIKFEINLGDL